MLKIISEEADIQKYQRQFVKKFKPFVVEKIPVHLGHPGASTEAKVLWCASLGIWMYSGRTPEGRHWNAFGIDKPKAHTNIPITCEINFPAGGIDRRIGGAIAKDRKGRVFIVHRGRIGGGKKGIGKSLFADHYRGVWDIMEDGDEETTVALIGALSSPRLVRQVAQYIQKIGHIKEIASNRSSQIEMKFESVIFRETLIGAKYCDLDKDNDAECDHGIVVKDLAQGLRRHGLKAGNDAANDLFLAENEGEIMALFHVDTVCTPASLHNGAAQLLLNSLRCRQPPKLILVIPERLRDAVEDKLRKLNVDILTYAWDSDKALFPGLQALLKRYQLRT